MAIVKNTDALDATLVLKVGYRGGGFSGYAEQDDRAIRTVQGELRRALETFLRREVAMACAGRTDAGVHAQAQYVSVPVTGEERERLSARRILSALQALTPDDIAIREVLAAPRGFSARFDARERLYRYRIVCGSAPALLWDVAWWHREPLDVDAMERAARSLVGEQDFKSFCKASSAVGAPTMRTVKGVSFAEGRELGEDVIAFFITASSFLHTMVRTIVGSLALVGEGRRDPAWLAEVIAARDRRAAGPTAPAKGLVLEGVGYGNGALAPWDERDGRPRELRLVP